MEMYEIYLITNKLTDKKYVGQTKSSIGYLNRFNQHCQESLNPKDTMILHKAMAKYGIQNFYVKRLLKDIPRNKIDFYEILWIKKLNTYVKFGNGYNMTHGGQGIHGYNHTNISKSKISDGLKNWWTSLKINNPIKFAEFCNYRRERQIGIPKSFKAKQNLSQATKKRFSTEEGTFKGKHHTEETRQKLSLLHGKKNCNVGQKYFTGVKNI